MPVKIYLRCIMKQILLISAVFAMSFCQAQQTTNFVIPCAGISAPADPSKDWNPVLTITEADQSDEEASVAIKDSLSRLYQKHLTGTSNQRSASAPNAPVVGTSILGNGFNSGTPNDNEIAIANNGHLISVQNSNIFRYRTNTSSAAGTPSLNNWASSLNNFASKYDPKVLYDPEANRFILVCLAGYTSGSTAILVGFSRTDSVNGAYNMYSLPGNPFNDTLWSDYPMIAANHQELFCTVNLLHDNMSWQTGFVQTLIWQVNKWDGYAGDTLRMQLHSGINFGGRPIRNLCPVEGGSGVYPGPDMYFVSDRNLAASNDTIFLVHLSDTANAPGQQITVTHLISNRSYFMPANARQPNYGSAGRLATNDSRILGAFIQNDKIQFVGNSMDTTYGNCAVHHGIISNVSTTPSLNVDFISDPSLDFGYPNIAYVGHTASDNSAMLVFLHADSLTNPGVSAVVTDGNGQYSNRTVVKAGTGYIDLLAGDERWGDYTGIQRKYDLGGTCWVNGMFGLASHSHATWVAELGVSSDVPVVENTNETNEVSVYPNPFADQINISFENQETQQIRLVIYDMSGRIVQVLLDDQLPSGEIRFSFSSTPLTSGVYILKAESANGNSLFSSKLVKE
jgi:uncharacterized lipoprotein YajG